MAQRRYPTALKNIYQSAQLQDPLIMACRWRVVSVAFPLPIPKIGIRSSGVVQLSRWALTGLRGVSPRGERIGEMIRIDPVHLKVEPMDMSTDTAVARIVAVFGAAMPPFITGRFSWRKISQFCVASTCPTIKMHTLQQPV